ncbi:MAG: cytochrome c biogenesis protein CcdA [Planctomycetota bacterium]|nr:cytochrome c biogenesis protein CcdA [Planctomycetota bacterium]MDI6788789.1 cytochrome c biogenesis protein CcdA [Planctomycetota bacterium]
MESVLQQLNLYLQKALETGSLTAYGVVFLGGILTSLTPCVYPLIPIVASYVGGRTEKSIIYSLFLSVFYVIGLAITYACLGVLASLGGKVFGDVQTNPWVNFAVGNLIILFGLSLLDVFRFPFLGSLGASSGASKGRGIFGALFLGLTSGFICAPCTTAILAALLTFVAAKQSIFFGGSLLFVYALGMGCLLIIIGTFSGFITSLPKAGDWMNVIQKIFGVVIILVGEYFLIKAGELGLFMQFR